MKFKDATHYKRGAATVDAIVADIQKKHGYSLREIAKKIGIGFSTLRDLIHGRSNHNYPTQYILESLLLSSAEDTDMKKNLYYVIETKYVGPNEDAYIDADRVEIKTTPAVTNSSREKRIEGWCGTTNDWAVYAHGEYATLDEARAALADKFGEARSSDANGDLFESDDDDVIESYALGKYIPMNREDTGNWVYESMQSDIDAETSDDRIAELVAQYEAAANAEGRTLSSHLESMMLEYRDEEQ